MKCQEVEKLIPFYLEGEVGILKSFMIKRHILKCKVCSKTLKEEMELKKSLFFLSKIKPELGEEFYYCFERKFLKEKEKIEVKKNFLLLPLKAGLYISPLILAFFIMAFFERKSLLEREKEILSHLELYENFEIISELENLLEER